MKSYFFCPKCGNHGYIDHDVNYTADFSGAKDQNGKPIENYGLVTEKVEVESVKMNIKCPCGHDMIETGTDKRFQNIADKFIKLGYDITCGSASDNNLIGDTWNDPDFWSPWIEISCPDIYHTIYIGNAYEELMEQFIRSDIAGNDSGNFFIFNGFGSFAINQYINSGKGDQIPQTVQFFSTCKKPDEQTREESVKRFYHFMTMFLYRLEYEVYKGKYIQSLTKDTKGTNPENYLNINSNKEDIKEIFTIDDCDMDKNTKAKAERVIENLLHRYHIYNDKSKGTIIVYENPDNTTTYLSLNSGKYITINKKYSNHDQLPDNLRNEI